MSFPFTKQPDSMDCGSTCQSMVSEHYGKRHTLEHLRRNCFIGRDGVSLLGISPHSLKFCTVLYPYGNCLWLSDDYVDGCS